MPTNLLKKYNQLLELSAYNNDERKQSLINIFDRDITKNNCFLFRNKQIQPTPQNGKIKMDILYYHLTTVIVEKKTNRREFDIDRSIRLHWIKYHIEEKKKNNMLVFSVKEPNGLRTYIYDKDEKYVIVLEPLKNENKYYLLTAYHLKGKDDKRNKILNKYKKRKLNELL